MIIQRRVYKFNGSRTEIRNLINGMSASGLTSRWVDKNNFVVKKKGIFPFYHIEGNISEVQKNLKLRTLISIDFRYIILYALPAGLFIYARTSGPENGMILTLASISLTIFIFLFGSAMLYNLKKNFKESIRLM